MTQPVKKDSNLYRKIILKKADGILIVYDITNKLTFENAENWIKSARDEITKNIPIYLVGNKSDLEEYRKVSIEEGGKLSGGSSI